MGQNSRNYFSGAEERNRGGGGNIHEQQDDCYTAEHFLAGLDRDFMCSPRKILQGQYTGEVLRLKVNRKAEGNHFHIALFDPKTDKYYMSVNAHLDCDYSLGPTSKGCRVPGGWNWPGWGYGQCQLFPPEDATVRHVDLEESIYFSEVVRGERHVSGPQCINVDREAGIDCWKDGCGRQIHCLRIKTFATEPQEWPFLGQTKTEARECIFLSLVGFFGADVKVALHRHGDALNRVTGAVAWFTKDRKQLPLGPLHLDTLKLQQANKTYFTAVPKGNRKRCMSLERWQMIAAICSYFIFIIAAFLVFSIYIRISRISSQREAARTRHDRPGSNGEILCKCEKLANLAFDWPKKSRKKIFTLHPNQNHLTLPPNLERFFVAFSYKSLLQVPAESTVRAMTSARKEAQLEGSGLGAGGWWVVEDGVEVQGSNASESGSKGQRTGHALCTQDDLSSSFGDTEALGSSTATEEETDNANDSIGGDTPENTQEK